jgi:hypothetical protein
MQEVEYRTLKGKVTKSHKKSQKVCTPSRAHLHLYRRVEHCSKWWKWTQTLSRLVKVHVEGGSWKRYLEVEVVTDGVHVS